MRTALLDPPPVSRPPSGVDELRRLSDAELLAGQRRWVIAQRQATVGVARYAAEIARRSRHELGHSGLAQRSGARSPEQFVQRLAGVTADEAAALVRVGLSLEASGSPVTEALLAGDISLRSADAITAGLGAPSQAVTAEALDEAARALLVEAPDASVARTAQNARALRDALDGAAVADREEHLRQRRYLRLIPQLDGMTRVSGLLDPESAAIVTAAFDEVSSPRRGGPRFIDPAAQQHARRILDDPRTTDQLLADALVELVRIATAADQGTVFVQRRPAVQLRVDVAALETGAGSAVLDGQAVAVSVASAKRNVCASGFTPILFRGGDAIDVGRSQRFHTSRQRIALAARDGGCRFPLCDRPPSWCEAHHATPWGEGGETTLENGILLCRFHHHTVHAQGWSIRPDDAAGFLAIPPSGDPRPLLPMPPRRWSA